MINSVEFFDLAHSGLMSWSLALGFELGAAASLAAIVILEKTNRAMVWGLFLLLTAFQMMGNSYHAFVNLEDYMGWIELFGLQEEEVLFQKRILSVISGAVLPLVALGFIKSLIDYIRPSELGINEESFKQVTYQREASTPMKVAQPSIVQQVPPSEDLIERVKENQAKLTEEPEDYEDYDSEGNIIIPPHVITREVKEKPEINKYGEDDWATPNTEETSTKTPSTPLPTPKVGRRIVGIKGKHPKPRE
jgi:hypothetical protein